MNNEIFARVQERIRSMGLSDEAVAAKLKKYEFLAEGNEPEHLSAYAIHDLATDLMTTFHWVITGEQDPADLHMGVRNVLNGSDGTGGNKDWVAAGEALSDAAMAYEQVSLGPSPKFGWTEPKNVEYAMARLNEDPVYGTNLNSVERIEELFGGDVFVIDPKADSVYGTDLDFFGRIEEFFGVDVFVVKSHVDFDAVGAMVLGSPFIVAKQGLPGRQGHYAVARELACILSGNLARYSDVYAEDAPLDMWSMDFCIMLMESLNGLASVQDNPYAEQRFPKRVVEAHRHAVAEKHNLGYFLEWMTGEKPPVVEHDPIDLDELAKLFGLD